MNGWTKAKINLLLKVARGVLIEMRSLAGNQLRLETKFSYGLGALGKDFAC